MGHISIKYSIDCFVHKIVFQVLKKEALSICDMIKGNESDVGDIGFEILAKTVFQFLCFILFLALTNSS